MVGVYYLRMMQHDRELLGQAFRWVRDEMLGLPKEDQALIELLIRRKFTSLTPTEYTLCVRILEQYETYLNQGRRTLVGVKLTQLKALLADCIEVKANLLAAAKRNAIH